MSTDHITPEKPHEHTVDSESSPIAPIAPIAPNAPLKRKADGLLDMFDLSDIPTRSIKEMLEHESNKTTKVHKENIKNNENTETSDGDASPLKGSIYELMVKTEKELDAQRDVRVEKQMRELGTKLSEEEYEKLAGSDEGFELVTSA